MFWRKKKSSKAKAAKAVASSLETRSDFLPIAPLAAINDVVLSRPVSRERAGGIGMQGYAPKLAISKNRRYCEYCAERVVSDKRHVCWGNAEHHMHTLTAEERVRIMAQLAAKPKKATRAQLRKLYASDSGPPAEY